MNEGGDGVKVRFHLGAGPNKGHFQVRDGNDVRYYDPEKFQLRMRDGRLHNRQTTAKRINCGEINKTVCSWIDCESLEIAPAGSWDMHPSNLIEVSYNPKVAPYWRDPDGGCIDGEVVPVLQTVGKKVYRVR